MSATLIASKQMTLGEHYDGEVLGISDESPEHALLRSRIEGLLKNCFVYLSDVKIKVPSMPLYRYSGISALCDTPIYEEFGERKLLVNPTLIIEVLSPTGRYNRHLKFKAYKSIESLREYLVISQEERFVILYTKHNEKFWFQSEYVAGESLKLESLDCELSVDEIYQGIL